MADEGREYITPEIDRRQYRRAKLVAHVRCESLGLDDVLVTRDVSIGGVFIQTKKPLPRDSEVTLSFRLQPSQPPIQCRGKVVYSGKDVGMGIQFFDINEESRESIRKFVDESS